MNWIDPDCLPRADGVVARYLPTAEGGVDGLLLDDGTEVYLGTALGQMVAAAVQPGGAVQVRGLKPTGASMLVGIAVTPAGGAMLRDETAFETQDRAGRQAAQKAARQQARAGGQRETRTAAPIRPLHGGRGELRGVLLDDGTLARVPTAGAAKLDELLREGGELSLSGEVIATPHGAVLLAGRVGRPGETMKRVGRAAAGGTARAAADPAAQEARKAERRDARKQERQTTRTATREAARAAKRETAKADRMAAKKAERQAKRVAAKGKNAG